jgi:hypothetical protein
MPFVVWSCTPRSGRAVTVSGGQKRVRGTNQYSRKSVLVHRRSTSDRDAVNQIAFLGYIVSAMPSRVSDSELLNIP